MEKNIEVSLLLDFYGELLKPSCRQMAELYYNDDLSLAEVAAETGITRQGVRDRIKRGEKQLFEFEQKLGLTERYRPQGARNFRNHKRQRYPRACRGHSQADGRA